MSGHLEERVSALVDGELSREAAERAWAHVARCATCLEAVESQRLVKARLQALAPAEPSAALLARLREMGGPAGPLPPRRTDLLPDLRPTAGGPGRARQSTRPPAGRPAGRAGDRTGRWRRARRRARLALGAAGVAAALGTGMGALVLAGGADSPPGVVPPVDAFTLEHAVTSGTSPFTDPAAVAPAAWSAGR